MKDKKESFDEYEIFHIHRIMSVLLEAEYPANTHGKDGKTTNGTYLVLNRQAKVDRIIRSLMELQLISYEEKEKILHVIEG